MNYDHHDLIVLQRSECEDMLDWGCRTFHREFKSITFKSRFQSDQIHHVALYEVQFEANDAILKVVNTSDDKKQKPPSIGSGPRRIYELQEQEHHPQALARILKLIHPSGKDYMCIVYPRYTGDLNYFRNEYKDLPNYEHELQCCLRTVAPAIFYLHENHLLHRDIKPGNIFNQRSEDNTLSYFLGDFGSVCQSQEEMELEYHGTLEFQPLALLRAWDVSDQELTMRTRGAALQMADLFGLVATLYTLLTNKYVYSSSSPHEHSQRDYVSMALEPGQQFDCPWSEQELKSSFIKNMIHTCLVLHFFSVNAHIIESQTLFIIVW